jgi:hypothetical protein
MDMKSIDLKEAVLQADPASLSTIKHLLLQEEKTMILLHITFNNNTEDMFLWVLFL